jgi:hypothetical protein
MAPLDHIWRSPSRSQERELRSLRQEEGSGGGFMAALLALMLRGISLIFFGQTLIVIYGVLALIDDYTSVLGPIFLAAGLGSFFLGIGLWKAADWVALRDGQARRSWSRQQPDDMKKGPATASMPALVAVMLRGVALVSFGYTLIVTFGALVLMNGYTSADAIFLIAGVGSFLLGAALWKAAGWVALRYGQPRHP